MKKFISMFMAVTVVFSIIQMNVSADDEINIHVSVVGNDITGDGSVQNPFATIAGAKEYAAVQNKESKINVLFHKGVYTFSDTAVFSSGDSGTADSPVTYKAYGDGEVVFSGGIRLNGNEFYSLDESAIKERFPINARDKILCIDLAKYGISYDTVLPVLSADGENQTIARYPNTGMLKYEGDKSTELKLERAVSADWKHDDDIQVVGSLSNGYTYSEARAVSISSGILTLSETVRNGADYFVRNIPEELDVPGEYIIKDNILYYYPVSDIGSLNLEAAVFNKNSMININGAEYIDFEGITFRNSVSSAVTASNCRGINIRNCNFKNLICMRALNINGNDCMISDNYVYGLAGAFIYFSGGSRQNLTPGNVIIKNNRIASCGDWYLTVPAMIVSGENSTVSSNSIGNSVINNIIQDCNTKGAVSVPGNNNKVRYNEIFNQSTVIDDGGAIYFGKSNTKYGNDVSYNYIHDLNPDTYYSALYSDDGYGGLNMHHNVMADLSYALLCGMGMNNKFNDNMLINCNHGLAMGTRMTWGSEIYGQNGQFYQETRGIISGSVDAVANAYKEQYPDLEVSLSRKPFFAPWNTEITGNVSFGSAKAINSFPNHAYMTNDSYTIEYENEVEGIENALYMNGSRQYVNEIKAYGAKIQNSDGVDLNCTEAGNPRFDYSKEYFENADTQNYTLTSKFSSDISSIDKIDMSEIGIINTTNKNIFNNLPKEVRVYASAVIDDTAVLTWKNVEKATQYKIVISENKDLSEPIITDTVKNPLKENHYEFGIENGKTYYYMITAEGMSAQDSFSIESRITELGKESGIVEITRFEPDMYSTDVYVEGSGFEADSLVSVMVVNKETMLSEAFEDKTVNTIRFTDTVTADSNGCIAFSFDTSINDIDYTGDYMIYITDSSGTRYSRAYTYGTIEVSEINISDENGNRVNKSDIYLHKGQNLNLSMTVLNRMNSAIKPSIFIGTYDSGVLKSISVTDKDDIFANSEKNINISFTVPEAFTDKSEIKMLLWNDSILMKPLTKVRIISEADKSE